MHIHMRENARVNVPSNMHMHLQKYVNQYTYSIYRYNILCICIILYICMHDMYVCLYACTCLCMYVCMYVFIFTYTHTHLCMFSCFWTGVCGVCLHGDPVLGFATPPPPVWYASLTTCRPATVVVFEPGEKFRMVAIHFVSGRPKSH